MSSGLRNGRCCVHTGENASYVPSPKPSEVTGDLLDTVLPPIELAVGAYCAVASILSFHHPPPNAVRRLALSVNCCTWALT
jgi:hypothetical protein